MHLGREIVWLYRPIFLTMDAPRIAYSISAILRLDTEAFREAGLSHEEINAAISDFCGRTTYIKVLELGDHVTIPKITTARTSATDIEDIVRRIEVSLQTLVEAKRKNESTQEEAFYSADRLAEIPLTKISDQLYCMIKRLGQIRSMAVSVARLLDNKGHGPNASQLERCDALLLDIIKECYIKEST